MLKPKYGDRSLSSLPRRGFLAASGALFLAAANDQFAQIAEDRGKSDQNCVFCRIVSGKQSTFKVWEDRNYLAFLDHKPINTGHTLLIPKDHYEYLFDMPEKMYSRIMHNARALSAPLQAAMTAKRIGVIVEGFGVNHCHVHLVPINGGGELLKKGRTDVSEQEFFSIADRVKAAIGQHASKRKA